MDPASERYLQAASAEHSPEAWVALGEALFDAGADPATIARRLPELEARLQSWPDELRTAHLAADNEDHDAGRVGWDPYLYGEPAGPWLALVRTLVATPEELLASPDDSMWARHAFPAVRRWEVKRVRGLGAVADAVPRLPALRTLSFRWIALDGPPRLRSWPELFSRELPRLEHLDLAGMQLPVGAIEALVAGPLAHTVRRLDLADCNLRDAGAAALAAWPRPSRLGWLDLSEDRITQRGLEAIARGRLLDGLSDLVVAGNQLDRPGLAALAAAAPAAALRAFDGHGAGLTDDMLEPLARSEHLRDLAALRLADNRLTDDAVDRLLDARFAPALVELDLRHNQLTAAAAERFTRRPRPPRLQRLRLAGNRIPPDLLAAITRWAGDVRGLAD